jgi:hypothetical protein
MKLTGEASDAKHDSALASPPALDLRAGMDAIALYCKQTLHRRRAMLLTNRLYRRTRHWPRSQHRPLRRRPLLELLEARNLLSFSNVLVNNPAFDTTAQDTQSETAITLGAGSNVIVAYNDSVNAYADENYHLTGHSLSANGGATFEEQASLPVDPHHDEADPTLGRSAKTGTVLLSTLSVDQVTVNPNPPPPLQWSGFEQVNVYRSTNNGAAFDNPVNATPGFDPNVDLLDKPWIAVDNFRGPGYGNVYLVALHAHQVTGGSTFDIVLTRSTDDGLTWGPSGGTTIVSSPGPYLPTFQGANVTVGPDHAVYVSWWDDTKGFGNSYNGQILMRKSTDEGVTFGDPITVATLRTPYLSGDLLLTDSGGHYFGTNAFPQAVVNPVTGDIYVAYDDRGNGSQQPKDKGNIYFTQSTDGGQKWSKPLQVNDDLTNNDQWFPALAVTPDGSHVGLFWYDRRLDPVNNLIDRFGAIGTVCGHTVSFGANFRITDTSFPPVFTYWDDSAWHIQDPIVHPGYMGDYDQAVADNNYFYTTWGDNRLADAAHTNNPDVRFAKIPVGCEEADSSLTALAATSSAASVTDPSALPSSQASWNGLAVDAYFMDFVRTGQTIGSVTRGDLATWPYISLAPPSLPGSTDQVVQRSAQVSSMLTSASTQRAAYGLADDWLADVLVFAGVLADGEAVTGPVG